MAILIKNIILSEQMQARISSGHAARDEVLTKTAELAQLINQSANSSNFVMNQIRNRRMIQIVRAHPPIADLNAHITEKTYRDETQPVLYRAVLLGNPSLIRAMLAKGADANTTDDQGTSLLYHSASLVRHPKSQREMMQAFLDYGANPCHVGLQYNDVITELIGDQNMQAVEQLRRNGADFTFRTANKRRIPAYEWQGVYYSANQVVCPIEMLRFQSEHMMSRISPIDPPAYIEDQRAIKEQATQILQKLDDTQTRFRQFIKAPDVTAISTEELINFATIGKLKHSFNPNLWRHHLDLAEGHFHKFPRHLQEQLSPIFLPVFARHAHSGPAPITSWTASISGQNPSDKGRSR